MRYILFIFLVSCGSTVTRDNALKECPVFYNVECKQLIKDKDYPVVVLGKKVKDKCGLRLGCTVNNTIYTWDNDWLVIAHERCHNYCGPNHVKTKREIKAPYIR